VAAKSVPASDLSADLVRQMRNLKDMDIDRLLNEVWGITRATPADKAKTIAELKKALSAPYEVDLPLGRAVYAKVCMQCHTLYGAGGKVGPDITGSNRANLDYLLENIVDPSAVIPKEYAAHVLNLTSGRVITGIVKNEVGPTLQVQTANEVLTLAKDDIESRVASPLSMMPDDLIKPLTPAEVRRSRRLSPQPDPVADPLDEGERQGLLRRQVARHVARGHEAVERRGERDRRQESGDQEQRFPASQMVATDFRLTIKVKLVPDAGNSGVQFRSEPFGTTEMKGPQADVGAGWWGKLYEESGRGLLWAKSGEAHVRKNEWNTYEIIAKGSKVQTFINGQPCVDLDDPKISRRGIFALQIHSGPAMEVRFKDLHLECSTPDAGGGPSERTTTCRSSEAQG